VIGALLTLPGVSYLAALNRIGKLDYSTAETTLVVIGFNLVMLILLEGPLVAFTVAPERTPVAIERAKQWARGHGRKYAARGLTVIGALLVVKGVIEFLA
jgi:hypothetical protein